MACIFDKDYPLRARYPHSKIVHGGKIWHKPEHSYNTFLRNSDGGWVTDSNHHMVVKEHIVVPSRDVLVLACKHYNTGIYKYDYLLISNKNPITCKQCLKTLGMLEHIHSGIRYALLDTETNEFYRKTPIGCSHWTTELTDASLYRTEAGIIEKAKKEVFFNASGNQISFEEYSRKRRKREKTSVSYQVHPKYKVKEVTITAR